MGDAPADYIEKMLGAIVAIEIPIATLVGKWKVSQNRSAADREGVAREFEAGEQRRDGAAGAHAGRRTRLIAAGFRRVESTRFADRFLPVAEVVGADGQPFAGGVAEALPFGLGREAVAAREQVVGQQAGGHQGCAPGFGVGAAERPRLWCRRIAAITTGASRQARAVSAPTTAWSVRWLAFSVSTKLRSRRTRPSIIVPA